MIIGFLEAKTPDYRGRMIVSLWKQTDHQAESTHDYIQWLFPLDEPSRSVNGAPILTELDIDEIKESSLAQANLTKSARWFLGFLKRNPHWVTKSDHNHLRITSAIKTLVQMARNGAADEFKKMVFEYLGDDLNLIDSKASCFWNSA